MGAFATGNPFATLASTDFLDAAQRQFPTGAAWPDDPASVWVAFLSALADMLAAVNGRASDLTERESDPAQTVQLLPAWEADYGLPDPCTPANPTLSQRQAALLAKIASSPGGQDPAYFLSIATALGYGGPAVDGSLDLTDQLGNVITDDSGNVITAPTGVSITTFPVFTAGSPCGAALNGMPWKYTWQINTPGDPVTHFCAGSGCGERLTSYGNAELVCRINAVAPAHTTVLFAS